MFAKFIAVSKSEFTKQMFVKFFFATYTTSYAAASQPDVPRSLTIQREVGRLPHQQQQERER